MKKLIVCACMILGFISVKAQVLTAVQDTVSENTNSMVTKALGLQFVPNKLGIGVGIGTAGVTIDLSTHFSDYIGLRAGVNWVPEVKVNTDLDLSSVSGLANSDAGYSKFINEYGAIPDKMKVQGKLSMTTFHVLFDVYPFAQLNSFHVTVGGYFGAKKTVEVYNKEDGALKAVSKFNSSLTGVDPNTHEGTFTYTDNNGTTYSPVTGVKQIGVELGDYFLRPTDDGNLNSSIQVSGFRPYVGIGIGRAVPRNRIGIQCDLGCQFWGTPNVYVSGAEGEEKLTKENTDGKGGDALKIMSKITVYPTLTIRLTGRIL